MVSTQELIEQMNSGGASVALETPAANPPATTPPATPPETPPSNSTQPPVVEPTPSEPSNKSTTETPKPSTEPPATPPAAQEVPDEIISTRLSKLTNGKVKSLSEVEGILSKYGELEALAAEGFKPKFKNERAKLAHDILANTQGDEIDTAMRTLRALKFNPEGKTDKDVLFESFLLDPNNADLSEAQALKVFEAKFNKEYGEMDEEDVLKKRELSLAVKQAKDNIFKIQNEFKVIEERPRAVATEIENSVSNAVKGFKGLKIAFSDNPAEGETLNVGIANPQELEALQTIVLNPDQAYNDLVSSFETEKGFDYEALIQEVYARQNHKLIRKLAYEQGIKKGELNIINKSRNASDPKQIGQVATPGSGKANKSFLETFAEAQGQQ